MVVGLVQFLFFLVALAGIGMLIWKIYSVVTDRRGFSFSVPVSISVLVIGLLGYIWWSSAEYISPTEIGVVENQTNGSLTTIGRGLHVFPFDTKLIPLVTTVTKYSFSSKTNGENSLVLGDKDDLAKRIASTSTTEGHPIVYFWVKVVAVPNTEHIITLHRRYGKGYLSGYVKDNFESAVKTVQGQKEFDYMSEHRAEFEREVATELNRRLSIETTEGKPLVSVIFVNVLDYDYNSDVNAQLNKIVLANNEAEASKALIETAANTGKATNEKAEADKKAVQTAADGLLYQKVKEAEGIEAVQRALSNSPTYIALQQVQKWNGILPTFMGGNSPIPFFDMTSATQSPVTPAAPAVAR